MHKNWVTVFRIGVTIQQEGGEDGVKELFIIVKNNFHDKLVKITYLVDN